MRTILLVEDDPLLALVRKSNLEKRFPSVKRVSDAADALCFTEQRAFSRQLGLIVCGHLAPGLSAHAFVAEIHDRLSEVPILVLGGRGEVARDYEQEGVRFLASPVSTEQILSAAGELILSELYTAA